MSKRYYAAAVAKFRRHPRIERKFGPANQSKTRSVGLAAPRTSGNVAAGDCLVNQAEEAKLRDFDLVAVPTSATADPSGSESKSVESP